MDSVLGSSRSFLAAVAVLSTACTTGVDEGVTSFGTAPNPTTPGVTTFEDTGDPPATEGEDVMTMGGSADETAGTGTTAPGTTSIDSGTTSDESGTTGPVGCSPPCGATETCMDGVCVPTGGGCNDVPGNYVDCLGVGNVTDTTGCGGGTPTCITGGDPVIAGVCSQTNCVDACDCPGAPPTGNAVVTCDAITGDGTNFCYLDCSSGETCPTGMVCFADIACIWPGEGADGVPYGDCLNNGGSICGLDGVCLSDDVMAPSVSVCTQDCAGVGACPASPGGTAAVTCDDVTTDGFNECYLDCTFGSCPAGMTCFAGFICMWD